MQTPSQCPAHSRPGVAIFSSSICFRGLAWVLLTWSLASVTQKGDGFGVRLWRAPVAGPRVLHFHSVAEGKDWRFQRFRRTWSACASWRSSWDCVYNSSWMRLRTLWCNHTPYVRGLFQRCPLVSVDESSNTWTYQAGIIPGCWNPTFPRTAKEQLRLQAGGRIGCILPCLCLGGVSSQWFYSWLTPTQHEPFSSGKKITVAQRDGPKLPQVVAVQCYLHFS